MSYLLLPVNRLKKLAVGATAASTLFFVSQVQAFERNHSAHEHGHAKLTLVIEGDEVVMEFHSPAMNIVGFEHQPSSHDEKHAVEEAVQGFKENKGLFLFNAEAGCALEHSEVETALLEKDAHGDSHHEEDENHDHESEGEHESHEKHDDHDHHDSDEETHSEFEVSYHYECQAIDKLQSLELGLFSTFSSLQEVEVQLAGPKGQQVLELNQKQRKVEF